MKIVIINSEKYIEIESEEDWENFWNGKFNSIETEV
jgi:hypothetical protein